jgi:hypothetical protein
VCGAGVVFACGRYTSKMLRMAYRTLGDFSLQKNGRGWRNKSSRHLITNWPFLLFLSLSPNTFPPRPSCTHAPPTFQEGFPMSHK